MIKKIVLLTFLIPLYGLSQSDLTLVDNCTTIECENKNTKFLRDSNQSSKDFFKNSIENFYNTIDLLCLSVITSKEIEAKEDEKTNLSYQTDERKNIGDGNEISFSEIKIVPRFLQCHLVVSVNARTCFQEQIVNHITKNLIYPETAQKEGIEGRVYVKFIINRCGFIEKIRTEGPDKALEEEAFRIINLLPRMSPGKLDNGTPMDVSFSLPIAFRLN